MDGHIHKFLKRLVKVHRGIYPEDRRDDTSIAKEMLDHLVKLGSVHKNGSQYEFPPNANWDQLNAYMDQFEKG